MIDETNLIKAAGFYLPLFSLNVPHERMAMGKSNVPVKNVFSVLIYQ
jgi:hypothetical protein